MSRRDDFLVIPLVTDFPAGRDPGSFPRPGLSTGNSLCAEMKLRPLQKAILRLGSCQLIRGAGARMSQNEFQSASSIEETEREPCSVVGGPPN